MRYAEVESECQQLELLRRQSLTSPKSAQLLCKTSSWCSHLARLTRATEEDECLRSTHQTLEHWTEQTGLCIQHSLLDRHSLELLAEELEVQHRKVDEEQARLQSQFAKLETDKVAYKHLLTRLEEERTALIERERLLQQQEEMCSNKRDQTSPN